MKKINNIEEFIKFIIELIDDEFDYTIDYVDAWKYFMSGGCMDLAMIVHHFFPNTSYAVMKNGNHIAICDNKKIYDALSIFDEDTLKELNLESWEIDKDLNNYEFYKNEEDLFNHLTSDYGRNIKIEGKNFVDGIINEINDIPSIKVGL